MALKYFYYVIVLSEGQAKFVTKVDNATKKAYWDSKEKPLAFTKTQADDLALCLFSNSFFLSPLNPLHKSSFGLLSKQLINAKIH